jgi:hypothetical protein
MIKQIKMLTEIWRKTKKYGKNSENEIVSSMSKEDKIIYKLVVLLDHQYS